MGALGWHGQILVPGSAASALNSGQPFTGRWPKAGALLAFTGMGGGRGHKLALKSAFAGADGVGLCVLSACQ